MPASSQAEVGMHGRRVTPQSLHPSELQAAVVSSGAASPLPWVAGSTARWAVPVPSSWAAGSTVHLAVLLPDSMIRRRTILHPTPPAGVDVERDDSCSASAFHHSQKQAVWTRWAVAARCDLAQQVAGSSPRQLDAAPYSSRRLSRRRD